MQDRALPDDVVLTKLLPRVSVLVRMPDDAAALGGILDRIPVAHEVLLLDDSAPDGLRDAVAAASGDILVTLDARVPQSPEEIARFVTALCDGADVVTGSRTGARGRRSALSVAAAVLFGARCTDLAYRRHACWRAHAARLADAEDLLLVPVRAARDGLCVAEVPCRPGARPSPSPRETARLVRLLVRERLRPRHRAAATVPGRGRRPVLRLADEPA